MEDVCECGTNVHAKGMCRRCYARDYKRRTTGAKPRVIGPQSYYSMHSTLRKTNGPAKLLSCAQGLDHPAAEWSYKGAWPDEVIEVRTQVRNSSVSTFSVRWSPDLAAYEPLCKAHHVAHDRSMRTTDQGDTDHA